MRLLVKGLGLQGLVAHIADANGYPLCRTNIKRSDWQLQERSDEGIIICQHCKRIQAQIKDSRP